MTPIQLRSLSCREKAPQRPIPASSPQHTGVRRQDGLQELSMIMLPLAGKWGMGDFEARARLVSLRLVQRPASVSYGERNPKMSPQKLRE
jgi:hypothetical protein